MQGIKMLGYKRYFGLTWIGWSGIVLTIICLLIYAALGSPLWISFAGASIIGMNSFFIDRATSPLIDNQEIAIRNQDIMISNQERMIEILEGIRRR